MPPTAPVLDLLTKVICRQTRLERAVLIMAGSLVLLGVVIFLTRRRPTASAPEPTAPVGFHLEGVNAVRAAAAA